MTHVCLFQSSSYPQWIANIHLMGNCTWHPQGVPLHFPYQLKIDKLPGWDAIDTVIGLNDSKL